MRRVDEGFSEARVLAEVSLLPDKLRIATGRRAVAMATGVIEKSYNNREARKQVLVVVTSGWSVMCFDHNLKKLWDVNLQVRWKFYIGLMNHHHRVSYKNSTQSSFVSCRLILICFFNRRIFPIMLITGRLLSQLVIIH